MASATENRSVNIYINGREIKNDMKSIRGEYRKTTNQLNKMTRGSDEYNRKAREVKRLKGIIQQHNKSLRGAVSGWAKMKDIMMGVIGANVATNIFQRIISFIPEAIQGAAKLSDSFSDVQKNTDLTNEEMERLQKNLRQIDTRTKNSRLLDIAAAAGKSGVRGVENLTEIVRQLDQVEVALGDDLGDDAIPKLQKVAAVFNTEILNIGSGINALSDSTKANAGFLTEWVSRMAGASKQVKINAGDVLGYGTTLDELGLKVEMSSTALNGFLLDFVKNTSTFGEAAGFAEGELQKLIGEQGTNAGLLAFLERLKEGSTSSQDFLQKLEAVGVTGDRGSQVFLALSQNIDQLRKNQQLANNEIAKGTSLTREFEKRNNNLAGNLEKIQKALYATWANSTVKNGIDYFVKRIANYVKSKPSEEMEQERMEMNLLMMEIHRTNTNSEQRIKLIERLKEMHPEHLKNINAETISNEELSASIEKINDAMISKIILAKKDEEIQTRQMDLADETEDFLQRRRNLDEEILKIANKRNLTYDKEADRITQVRQLMQELEKDGYKGIGSDFFSLNFAANQFAGQEIWYNRAGNIVAQLKEQRKELEAELEQFLNPNIRINYNTDPMTNQELEDHNKWLEEHFEKISKDDNNKPIVEAPVKIKPVVAPDMTDAQLKAFAAQIQKANEEYMSALDDVATFGEINKETAAEIDEAVDPQSRIDGLIAYYEQLLTVARDYGYRTVELEDELNKLRKEKSIKKLQEIAAAFEEFYQPIMDVVNTVLQYENTRDNERIEAINRRRQAELAAIDDTAKHSMKTERQVAKEKEDLEKRSRMEIARIKEKQWRRQQAADIIQSAINVALAVTRQGVKTPQAIATGIAGAAKTAFIASQKPPKFYARGVLGSPRTQAIVGEQGPELIDLPEDSNVYTASQTEDLLSPEVQPQLNTGAQFSMGIEAIRNEMAMLRKDVNNWRTRLRGDWRKDEFDEYREREEYADRLVDF